MLDNIFLTIKIIDSKKFKNDYYQLSMVNGNLNIQCRYFLFGKLRLLRQKQTVYLLGTILRILILFPSIENKHNYA